MLLKDFSIFLQSSSIIYFDIMSSILLTSNSIYHEWSSSKHIEAHYYCVKVYVICCDLLLFFWLKKLHAIKPPWCSIRGLHRLNYWCLFKGINSSHIFFLKRLTHPQFSTHLYTVFFSHFTRIPVSFVDWSSQILLDSFTSINLDPSFYQNKKIGSFRYFANYPWLARWVWFFQVSHHQIFIWQVKPIVGPLTLKSKLVEINIFPLLGWYHITQIRVSPTIQLDIFMSYVQSYMSPIHIIVKLGLIPHRGRPSFLSVQI